MLQGYKTNCKATRKFKVPRHEIPLKLMPFVTQQNLSLILHLIFDRKQVKPCRLTGTSRRAGLAHVIRIISMSMSTLYWMAPGARVLPMGKFPSPVSATSVVGVRDRHP